MMPDAKLEHGLSSEEEKETVIFEDDEIKVLFWKGSSEKIIITFGDLISLATETRYFADTPLKKLGFTTIGFMAKRGNWFPTQSMHSASKKALPIISNYKKTVMYGGSMGGYAALKYSNLLKGNVIISLCPQWSIDPVECNGFQSGYEKYFTPEIAGMGITKNDLAGDIFAFYDPHHSIDSYHIGKIITLGHHINVIHVPYSGHHVTTVLAGTRSISALIDGAVQGDVEGLRSASSIARRTSAKRAQIVIEKSSTRHPLLAGRLVNSESHQEKLHPSTLSNIDSNILGKIDTAKHPEVALPILKRISARNKCTIRDQLLSTLYRNIDRKTLICATGKIQTYHDTFLCYDLSSGKLAHRASQEITSKVETLKFITAFKSETGPSVAGIALGENIYLCTPDKFGNILLKASTIDLQNTDDCIHINDESGNTRLKVRNNYVCANSRGDLAFDRPTASLWENYRIVTQDYT